MPSLVDGATITIEVIEGRNLVAKDRNLLGKKTSSDPYITLFHCNKKFGTTKVIKKSLNPQWKERFSLKLVQRDLVQSGTNNNEIPPVMLVIWDHDVGTADDPMGTVLVPIDLVEAEPKQLWLPVTKGTAGKYFCHNATGEVSVRVTVQLQMVLQLVKGNVHHLRKDSCIHVGLAWDPLPGTNIDLDASCVAISNSGELLMDETVYYGNPCNPNESVLHTGDETTGDKTGDDETILLNLEHIPKHVVAYYLILSVQTPNYTLEQIKSAKVRFYSMDNRGEEQSICVIQPSALGHHTSLIVARVAKESGDPKNWKLRPIEAGTSPSRDFGTLVPLIKGYTRDLLANIQVDPNERVAIMQKNGVIKIQDFCPSQAIPTTVSIGLAWDVTKGVSIDLDASVLCLDSDLQQVDVVYFNKLTSIDGSIQHMGDQRSGSAAGDDETINILLENVNPRTKYMGIVINSYSGQELDDVARASCRLYDTETRSEIARYTLTDSKPLDKHTALVMGCLYRGNEGAWLLTIISEPAQGKTVHDNLDELQNWLRRNHPPMHPTIEVQRIPSQDIAMSTMPAFVPHI